MTRGAGMICLILLPVMAADRPDGYLLAAISWNDAVSWTVTQRPRQAAQAARDGHRPARPGRARAGLTVLTESLKPDDAELTAGASRPSACISCSAHFLDLTVGRS